MSDVRAAAERVLACDVWYPRDRRHVEMMTPDWENAAELARMVLAEHPADDETPITELWWCDMNGGGRFMFSSDDCLMLFLDVDGMIELCVTNASGLREISYSLPHIKTRGDVRMLCRALGVEVNG